MEESGVFEYWFAFCLHWAFASGFRPMSLNQGPRHLDLGTGPLHCRFVYRTAAAFDQFDPRYHPFFVAELYKREL